MQPKYLQELIRNLQEFYKCTSCSTNYHFDDIKFLGEVEQYCFVLLSCHNCSLPMLATVTAQEQGVAKRKTDLRKAEEAKFACKGAISAGEIAEFHRWILKSKRLVKKTK